MAPRRQELAPGVFPLGLCELQFIRQSRDGRGSQKCFMGVRIFASPALVRQRLPAALRVAESKHPILTCVVTKDVTHGLVLEQTSQSIPVFEYPGEQWENVFARKACVPLALNKLPVEVFLAYADEASTSVHLFFALEHYCCDGASGRTLFHDVLNYMGGKDSFPPGPGYIAIPSDWAVEATALKKWGYLGTKLRGAHVFAEALAGLLLQPSESLKIRVIEADCDMARNNHPLILNDAMTREDTKKFIQGCRALGISVTGCITAIYLDAIAQVIQQTGHAKSPFQLSASIVTSPRAVTNPKYEMFEITPVAGSAPYFFSGKVYGGSETGFQRLISVGSSLGEMLKFESTPDRLILRNRLTPWGLSHQPTQLMPPSVVITSPGVGPIQSAYGDIKVDFVLTALNVNICNWPTVAICTDADRLVASLMAPVPRYSEDDIRKVQERAISLMREVCNLKPNASKL